MDVNGYDGCGRTPLLSAVAIGAPAGAVRALLDAGADPTLRHQYHDSSVLDEIGYAKRTDLDFVRDLLDEGDDE